MSDVQPETCPECEGLKRFVIQMREVNGRMTSKVEACLLCAGFGTVHPSLAAKYREAKRLKEATR